MYEGGIVEQRMFKLITFFISFDNYNFNVIIWSKTGLKGVSDLSLLNKSSCF